MVDVTPLVPEGRQIIQAYGDGRFRVSGVTFDCPILVLPTRTIEWAPPSPDDLQADDLEALLDGNSDAEVLLLGTGPRIAFLKPSVRQAIRDRGPVVDVMDTGAACRTFNVLLTEERRVAAALYPIG